MAKNARRRLLVQQFEETNAALRQDIALLETELADRRRDIEELQAAAKPVKATPRPPKQ